MWHSKSIEEIVKILETNIEKGLSEEEVKKRIKKYGLNVIKAKRKRNAIIIFLEQFNSILVWILIFAIFVSFFLGDIIDTILILSILIFNSILGFFQEYKAEKAIEMLKSMLKIKAKVIREGKIKLIDSEYLVPGDIVILRSGDKVPADIRIVESDDLYVDESMLTGESFPVPKEECLLREDTPLIERKNMLYMNSYVVKGYCKGIVVSTGGNTEIGKIAQRISEEEKTKTPLEREIDRTGKILGIFVLVVTLIVFTTTIFKGYLNIFEAFMASIALAVAVVPEGLPMIVTVTLALSARRLLKEKALIRKLSSAQTLGSVEVIFTDKTGTLTLNKMFANKIYFNKKIYDVTGEGYEPKGEIIYKGKEVNKKEFEIVGKICLYCNQSDLIYENGEWKIVGDPTEGALIVLARKIGLKRKKEPIKIFEFDRIRKRMSVIIKEKGKLYSYVKGAPDILLNISKYEYINGEIKELSDKRKKEIQKIVDKFAESGLRVIGLAYKEIKDKDLTMENSEKELIFVGLIGILDPPRKEVSEAIRICKKAGIDIIVLTGDHPKTAKAICGKVGIKSKVLKGEDIDGLSDEELLKKLEEIKIFARVNPEHKYRIVTLLKKKGKVVAMTGDGVNDAPALKRADIGIAMGSGTDIAKESSDMVLLDDSFSTIVRAVREGRKILENIREFVFFCLSTNIGKVLGILFSIVLGVGLPVKASHILWINFVSDGLLSFGLSMDPESKEILKKKPEEEKNILYKRDIFEITILGILTGFLIFSIAKLYFDFNTLKFLSVCFTSMVFFDISRILYVKKKYEVPYFKNKILLLLVFLVIFLQISILYSPLSYIFGTQGLEIFDWLIILSFVIILISSQFLILEFIKNIK